MDKTQIRNAATVIAIRDPGGSPSVLMGQRGSTAAFMPNKFVFPGGAVDTGDEGIPAFGPLDPVCRARLTEDAAAPAPETLAAAAIRELFEETGLILGAKGTWNGAPEAWLDFAQRGFLPDYGGLSFVFRAITPPGRPRRFDARFFLVNSDQLAGDAETFSDASDELRHLQWVPLSAAQSYDLPFITEIVLSEIARNLPSTGAPDFVPFFQNDDEDSRLRALGRS